MDGQKAESSLSLRKVTSESQRPTSIAAKIYNTLLLNRIEPEIEKILRKKSKRFLEKSIHNITHSNNLSNHGRGSCTKKTSMRHCC